MRYIAKHWTNIRANIEEEGVNRGNYALSRGLIQDAAAFRAVADSSNWCPMTGRKGEDLLNVLTFWTLHMLTFSSDPYRRRGKLSPLPVHRYLVCLTNRRETRPCVGVLLLLLLHSTLYAFTHRWKRSRERKREGGREGGKVVNPHMCDDNREPPVERHRYPRLSTWLQKEAPNFDRTRSSTPLCPTTPDNSPRYQLIPCLPCFEVESRSPIDEISFHLLLVPGVFLDLYLFSSLRKEILGKFEISLLFDFALWKFFYFTRDNSKSRNLLDKRIVWNSVLEILFQKFSSNLSRNSRNSSWNKKKKKTRGV